MAQDATKSQRIAFVAPFPVEKCVRRLRDRHEGRTFFAWDWQTRLTVTIKQVDDRTARFRLRRVDKNSLLAWGSMVELRGTLRSVDESHTAVQAEIHWSWVWMGFSLIAYAVIGIAFGVLLGGEGPLDTTAILLMVLTGLIGALVGLLFTWWWANSHLQTMTSTLYEVTGYLGPGQTL